MFKSGVTIASGTRGDDGDDFALMHFHSWPEEDEIAVQDAISNHRVAMDAKEEIRRLRAEERVDWEGFYILARDDFLQRSCGDGAKDWEASDIGGGEFWERKESARLGVGEQASFFSGNNETLAALGPAALDFKNPDSFHALEGGSETAFVSEPQIGDEIGDKVGLTQEFTTENAVQNPMLGS